MARRHGPEVEFKNRSVLGGDWILDAPEIAPAMWGAGQRVLWARGEPLMIVGGIGTGKTTIAQQLVLRGIDATDDGTFLGYPISIDGLVGYVAADRPAQIQRSWARMVTEDMRGAVNDRLDVWRGALPFALDTAPTGRFADFVQDRGWEAVVLDSLKDVCTGTTDDEAGLRINQQIQEAVTRGVEVLALHHQRKSTEGNRKPNKLDDVFGSRWLTAGMGSVLSLWADAGAELVEMRHLKQPADQVPTMVLEHDHDAGRTTVSGQAEMTVKRVDTRDRVLAAMPGTVKELVEAVGIGRRQMVDILASLSDNGLATSTRDAGNTAPVWTRVGAGVQ